MYDQQITYLSSNQRRTHMVRFLCCLAVKKYSNVKALASLSSAIFCRHYRDMTSDVCHGSTISSADCLWKLNHAQNVGQLYRSSDVSLRDNLYCVTVTLSPHLPSLLLSCLCHMVFVGSGYLMVVLISVLLCACPSVVSRALP